jgi:hypothetical protein
MIVLILKPGSLVRRLARYTHGPPPAIVFEALSMNVVENKRISCMAKGAIGSPPLICCCAPHIYCYTPVVPRTLDMMDG